MSPPNQEAEARRHHYVPQCWLAGFTETGENDGRLGLQIFRVNADGRQRPQERGISGIFTGFPNLLRIR